MPLQFLVLNLAVKQRCDVEIKSINMISNLHTDIIDVYGDRKGARVCREHSFIRAERLEELVWSEVKRVVQRPEVIIAGIESLRTEDDGQWEEKAAQVEKGLRSAETGDDRLIRLYVAGKISEAQLDRQRKFITGRVKGLRDKLDEYRLHREKAIEAQDLEGRVSQWSEAVRAGLDALSPEERREVMLLVLDQVTIDGDDRVDITLSIPTQELEAIEKPGSCPGHPGPAFRPNLDIAATRTGHV